MTLSKDHPRSLFVSAHAGSSRAMGSALLIMLWAVALLSATTLGLAVYLITGLDEEAAKSKMTRARQLAESGLAVVMHPLVERGDPVLRQQVSSVESFQVTMQSESARINLNSELADESSQVLQDLFVAWGMTLQEAQVVVDSLRDWIDADDLTRLDGMEYQGYAEMGFPQFPRNKLFTSMEEVMLCRGADLIAAVNPDWRTYFTLWSDGKINFNDAGKDALVYAVGLTEAQAESIIEARLGVDGLKDTEDDLVFENIEQMRIFLGLPETVFAPIAKKLTVADGLLRIKSIGRVAGLSITLSALVRKGGGESTDVSEILAVFEE